jgi:hypothetical protein
VTLALGTLVFLVAAWAAVTAVLAALDDNGVKIMAALRGQSLLARDPLPVRQVTVRFRQRYPASPAQPVRAATEWRAAA